MMQDVLQAVAEREKTREKYPAIKRLYRESDRCDIKGETPRQMECAVLAGCAADSWLFRDRSADSTLRRLEKLAQHCSKRIQVLIQGAIGEIKKGKIE